MNIDRNFTGTDSFGNRYFCYNGVISLILKSERRKRKLGTIAYRLTKRGQLLIFEKYDTERHIHRKTNSWSIPHFIYERVDAITVITTKARYKILKAKAEKNKEYLHFINSPSGTELKVYINVDLFYKE